MGAGQLYTFLAAIMVVNILVSVAYYIRLIQAIFFKEPSPKLERLGKVGVSMEVPLIVLAAAAILIGVYPSPVLDAALSIASNL